MRWDGRLGAAMVDDVVVYVSACILHPRSSSDVALHVEDADDPAPEAGSVSNLPLSVSCQGSQ